jgi:hypothetical protein
MSSYDNPVLRGQQSVSLAGTQVVLHFEHVSASIDASQVALMTWLNSQPDGAALNEVQTFFEHARRAWKDLSHGQTLDLWIRFLESYNLVLRRNDQGLVLTRLGREFLKWRVEMRTPHG